jgi:pimeloyl-ACP methyl ester carboxylesterase
MPSDPGEQPGGPPWLELHAERHGAGEPTLVFVHGFCCDGSDWENQVRRFIPAHQVLVPDLRGHGRSPASGECTERPTAVNAAIEKFISSLLA